MTVSRTSSAADQDPDPRRRAVPLSSACAAESAELALRAAVGAPSLRRGLSQATARSVLRGLAQRALEVVPGAVQASVTLVDRGQAGSLGWTGLMAFEVDEMQFELDRGPGLDALRGRGLQVVSDMRSEDRWPGYAPAAAREGCLSSVSTAIGGEPHLLAGLNVYSTAADAFPRAAQQAAVALADRGAVAIDLLRSYQSVLPGGRRLQAEMNTRAVIEQATGVLMHRHSLSVAQARQLLRLRSGLGRHPVRDLAADLVAGRTAPGPG